MPLYINTNTLSLNAQTHLSRNTTNLQKSMEKLASGFRINRAGDDAAGLQLSENLRSAFRGSQKAMQNVQDGRDFRISTFLMPLKTIQPKAGNYDENLLRAPTIGTINALTKSGHKAALITLATSIDELGQEGLSEIRDFFLFGRGSFWVIPILKTPLPEKCCKSIRFVIRGLSKSM